ncbi:PQQ-binding-like beta-propeller repeat protein [Nocardiopsis salina]|uniref:PQQ-binding-like beta-propeller repeat protein n=1 Tax=Nocardiopsis salina TaxID=245836 RepID=UPI00035C6353|nr:PQQ-binding-like beta-propeller repeat protein [Nocardiopsis salina]
MPPSPVRFWFASGLLLPGAVTFAGAAVHVHAATGSVPWPVHLVWAWGLLTVLALPLVRLHELERLRAAARGELGPAPVPGRSTLGRFLLLTPGRPRRVLASGTFAVSTVALTVLWWAPISPATGPGTPRFLDFSAYGLATGATGVLVALCLITLSPVALRGPRRFRAAGAGAGLATGSAAVALAAALTTVLPVEATTASSDNGDHDLGAGLPTTVEEVGWRWSTPDGGPVLEVIPARTGVLVRSAEGVALLNTATGEELWHYRRSGEYAVDMQASPGGNSVMLTYPARDVDGDPAHRLVVLEADTGQESGEFQSPRSALPAHYQHQGEFTPLLHRDVLTTLRRSDGRTSVAGYVPETGRERWTYEPLGDCARRGQDVTRHEVIVLLECDMDIMTGERGGRGAVRTLHGLVPSTGTWLWHTDVDMSAPGDDVWIHTSGDGHLFAFAWASDGGTESGNVLFGRNGEVVARDLPGFGGPTGHEGDWLFTSDGYLTWDDDGDNGTYTWRGLDGAERTASAGQTPSGDSERRERIRPVPLEDALVTADPRTDGAAAESITLAVRPWAEGEEQADDAEATIVDVALEPAEEGPSPDDQDEEWVSLHGAPRAVVLARPGSSEVVGLV